jgi:hypothetical protein
MFIGVVGVSSERNAESKPDRDTPTRGLMRGRFLGSAALGLRFDA